MPRLLSPHPARRLSPPPPRPPHQQPLPSWSTLLVQEEPDSEAPGPSTARVESTPAPQPKRTSEEFLLLDSPSNTIVFASPVPPARASQCPLAAYRVARARVYGPRQGWARHPAASCCPGCQRQVMGQGVRQSRKTTATGSGVGSPSAAALPAWSTPRKGRRPRAGPPKPPRTLTWCRDGGRRVGEQHGDAAVRAPASRQQVSGRGCEPEASGNSPDA